MGVQRNRVQLTGLSLVTAAIVHWNTTYLDLAVQRLRANGARVPDELLAHVAPLGWEHIGLTGDHVWPNFNTSISQVADPARRSREIRRAWHHAG